MFFSTRNNPRSHNSVSKVKRRPKGKKKNATETIPLVFGREWGVAGERKGQNKFKWLLGNQSSGSHKELNWVQFPYLNDSDISTSDDKKKNACLHVYKTLTWARGGSSQHLHRILFVLTNSVQQSTEPTQHSDALHLTASYCLYRRRGYRFYMRDLVWCTGSLKRSTHRNPSLFFCSLIRWKSVGKAAPWWSPRWSATLAGRGITR